MDPWSSFVASLLANFLATGLAILGALEVGRWLNRDAEKRQQAERTELLRQGIAALINSIVSSRNVLMTLCEDLTINEAPDAPPPLDAFLETDTWQSLRPILIPLLKDPLLVRELSAYFSNLEIVSRIIQRNIENRTGVISQTIYNWNESRRQRTYLLGRLPQLADDANRSADKLSQIAQSPSVNAVSGGSPAFRASLITWRRRLPHL